MSGVLQAGTLPRGADDRCPGALRLHEAADGWLARVRTPGGRLTAAQLAALAELGGELGSGLMDLTSRANVQLRGLGEASGAPLATGLAAAGLLPSPEHERVRNVLASPLAGVDPRATIDGAALVEALDAALCAEPDLAALPGRFQFAVEDGSGLLAGADADVTLVACGWDRVAIVLGEETTAHVVDATRAPAAALAAARAFLAARHATGSRAWRIRELGAGAVRAVLPGDGEPTELTRRAQTGPLPPGVTDTGDGTAAVTVLVPLGRLDARQLHGLAALGYELRVSPWRSVTLIGVRGAAVESTLETLRSLELVLDPDSGWQRLSACAGLGACPKARLDVRSAARVRAARRRPGDPPEHWSACERRCGEPRAEDAITVAACGEAIAVGTRKLPDLPTVMTYLEESRP